MRNFYNTLQTASPLVFNQQQKNKARQDFLLPGLLFHGLS